MNDIAVRVSNVSKLYHIGALQTRHHTLRDELVDGIKGWFRPCVAPPTVELWALKDVSFELRRGDVLGIIGKNGAGKSTLLKVLSRITRPTKGRGEVFGRVGSLLEVGTGFHPELTGRENTYLNGAILGMRKAEIDSKFDEIVAFAEIEKFIDTPVKRYSSGMYVRLAFAVAAHLEPEILIVDEVLAVGDAAFQKKCLGKIDTVAKSGRTVLLVSHNMASVQRLCGRAIWLDGGRLRGEGPTHEMLEKYSLSMKASGALENVVSQDRTFAITKLTTKGQQGEEKTSFFTGEQLRVELDYRCARGFLGAHLYVGIANSAGLLFAANMCLDGCRLSPTANEGKLAVTFKELPLSPQQQYYIIVGGRGADNRTPLFRPNTAELGHIWVVGSANDISLNGELSDSLIGNSTSVLVPYEWDLGNGRTYRIDSFRNVRLLPAETTA